MTNIILKNYTLLSKEEHINLLEIRNCNSIRENSISQEIIELDKHLSWIDLLKNDTSKSYFAIFKEDTIIGGINIFYKNEQITWGIFFDDSSSILIKSVIPIYFLEQVFLRFSNSSIYAEVLKTNTNALSFNKSLGFKEIVINNDIICLLLNNDTFTKKKKSILLKGIIKKMNSFTFKIEGLL